MGGVGCGLGKEGVRLTPSLSLFCTPCPLLVGEQEAEHLANRQPGNEGLEDWCRGLSHNLNSRENPGVSMIPKR